QCLTRRRGGEPPRTLDRACRKGETRRHTEEGFSVTPASAPRGCATSEAPSHLSSHATSGWDRDGPRIASWRVGLCAAAIDCPFPPKIHPNCAVAQAERSPRSARDEPRARVTSPPHRETQAAIAAQDVEPRR